MMKNKSTFKFLYVFTFVIIFFYSCNKHLYYSTYNHDNLNRTYVLYKPANLPKNVPLVFVLHSYGRYAKNHMQSLQLDNIADINKFMVCYPQGTLDVNTGKPYWTGGLPSTTIDDVGYLTDLAKYLQSKYNLDSNRTFVCGISNGGFMSYTLACESPDVFKAIASVEGTMTGHIWDNRNSTSHPIPVLQISGMIDKVVPIDGSMSTEYGWGGAPNMDIIMNYWGEFNKCKQVDTLYISSKIHAYQYKKGLNDNEVWYYKLEGFGHDLPTLENSGLNANELIWNFFSKF
jgi:polyhydroxybutyrate depolymerase